MRGKLAIQGLGTLKHLMCRLSFLPITLCKAFLCHQGRVTQEKVALSQVSHSEM